MKYYSDLVNSYAWDTAIVFIQAYEDSTYASSNNSTSATVTGGNGDQVCNINDMSGNKSERTTETSNRSIGENARPCTWHGGAYISDYSSAMYSTSYRNYTTADNSNIDVSFRITLCVK